MKLAPFLALIALFCGLASSAYAGWRHHAYPAAYYVPVAAGFPVAVQNGTAGATLDEAALTRAFTEAFRASGFGNAANVNPAAASADSNLDAIGRELRDLQKLVGENAIAQGGEIAKNSANITTIQGEIDALKKDMEKSKALARTVAQIQAQLPKKPSPLQTFVASQQFKTMLETILKKPGMTPEKAVEEIKAEMNK